MAASSIDIPLSCRAIPQCNLHPTHLLYSLWIIACCKEAACVHVFKCPPPWMQKKKIQHNAGSSKKEGKQDTAHITGQMDILSHKQSVTLAGSLLSSHSLQTKLLSALLHWSAFLPTRADLFSDLGTVKLQSTAACWKHLFLFTPLLIRPCGVSLCVSDFAESGLSGGTTPHSITRVCSLYVFCSHHEDLSSYAAHSFCTHTNLLMHSDSCISFCTVVSSYCQTER